MRTIAVESPYAANETFTVEEHTTYARLCMADCLKRGEAPFLSHLLYTQVLADNVPVDRIRGMAAGIAISLCLDGAAVYIDLGMSKGMVTAVDRYRAEVGFVLELRRLFTPLMGESLRAGRISLKRAMTLQ